MEFNLEPGTGALPLRFGDSRASVRQLLGSTFATKKSEPENDFYESDGLILGYDDKDELEFVEMVHPAVPVFRGVRLLDIGLQAALAALSGLGFTSPYIDGGYAFPTIGIALYCPLGKLESVSIYREGYYEGL